MQNFNEKVQFSESKKFGRHLIAAVNIEPGDVILEERPLMVTTHWEIEQMKCAKCCEDSFVICKKCQFFPLCLSNDCQQHDSYECEFFANTGKDLNKNLLINNYGSNSLIKLLLLMENPLTANKCAALAPIDFNLELYRTTESWDDHEDTVQIIIQSGLMDLLKNAKNPALSDAEFLHKLCILIDANAFEVLSTEGGDSLKGLYVHASKMPHSCIPNVTTAIDDEYNLTMYAGVAIAAGEIIYNSYTNPLMGTSQRQHHLRMTRNLSCNCPRCLDPTEMGTYMSSIKCKSCDGYTSCFDGNWKCEKCNEEITIATLQQLLQEVAEEIAATDGDVLKFEEILQKYSGEFHPNHFMMIDLKQSIATILRTILMNPMFEASREILERRLQLCKEIVPVVRAVIPGYSKLYAIALYEYLLSLLELSESDFKNKLITSDVYYQKLSAAKDIAAEARDLLKFEPKNSPEGFLVKRITKQHEQIAESLETLKEVE